MYNAQQYFIQIIQEMCYRQELLMFLLTLDTYSRILTLNLALASFFMEPRLLMVMSQTLINTQQLCGYKEDLVVLHKWVISLNQDHFSQLILQQALSPGPIITGHGIKTITCYSLIIQLEQVFLMQNQKAKFQQIKTRLLNLCGMAFNNYITIQIQDFSTILI